ncbi:uncharacterized protein LOC111286900 [Durio zibethinus]|uniref:Uncharacterized protein LOC111286900 n=1 Tax=Durio zibethinus TaxID=66656 RepID=A0A6P5XX61_DURZI|nr:uncharacterized protein LOC111286900 [Durio zibethinus]
MSLVPGRPLILYLKVHEKSIGCVLGLDNSSAQTIHVVSYYLAHCEIRPNQAIKGSAITELLVECTHEDYVPVTFDFPNEDLMPVLHIDKEEHNEDIWKMYFDGASNALRHAALERKNHALKVYGDSVLVIYQFRGEWETKDSKSILYQNLREKPVHCSNDEEGVDGKPWHLDILQYVKYQQYPEHISENDKKTLRRLAMSFFLDGEILYKRSRDQTLLRCMNATKAKKLLEKIHGGVCGTHPFSIWGKDVIGPITPKASNGHRFILVVIDYVTKWVEAASYVNMTRMVVCKFIKKQIICRYGLSEMIILDNALNLNNKMMIELPFALHAYRTLIHTSMGATPFSLVHGMEVVLPTEVKIPSLCILIEVELEESEWVHTRYEQLNLIEEKRLVTLCHGQLYQRRMMRKVQPRQF